MYEKEKEGTSHCFKFAEMVGMGIYKHICIYVYIMIMEYNWKSNICKSEYIVGAPFASLSIKHRIDRTTYSIENSHPKAYFANKEKQI